MNDAIIVRIKIIRKIDDSFRNEWNRTLSRRIITSRRTAFSDFVISRNHKLFDLPLNVIHAIRTDTYYTHAKFTDCRNPSLLDIRQARAIFVFRTFYIFKMPRNITTTSFSWSSHEVRSKCPLLTVFPVGGRI